MTDTRGEFESLLWNVLAPILIAAFATIVLLLLYNAFRSRRRAADSGWRSGWPKAELAYAGVLAAAIATILAFTFRAEARVDEVVPNPGLRIHVTAFQWQWLFSYPNGVSLAGSPQRPAQLVVPADTTVQFTMIGRDVIHSFWVPELRFKRDAFPKRETAFDLVFPDVGTFPGRCAEFCGLRHADMTFDVHVLSPEMFRAWLAKQAARG